MLSILVLQHLRPDGDLDTYHLRPGRRFIMGRGSGAHVRVLDPKLSRHHAALEVRDGDWCMTDLGSTNGVVIDKILAPGWTALKPGQRIDAGSSVFVVAALADPNDEPMNYDVIDNDPAMELSQTNSGATLGMDDLCYVILSGQRCGPLPRSRARELLTQDEAGELSKTTLATLPKA